jgi:hypothetical protein
MILKSDFLKYSPFAGACGGGGKFTKLSHAKIFIHEWIFHVYEFTLFFRPVNKEGLSLVNIQNICAMIDILFMNFTAAFIAQAAAI